MRKAACHFKGPKRIVLTVKTRRPPFFNRISGQTGQNTRRGEPTKDKIISVSVFRAMPRSEGSRNTIYWMNRSSGGGVRIATVYTES